MTCDEAKNLITIGVFGTPDPDDAAALEDHVRRCPSCARILRRSSAPGNGEAMNNPADLRMPDWEQSWDVIARRSLSTRKEIRIFGLPRPWAFAAAALAGVFILGFIAGRRFLKPARIPVMAQAIRTAEASPWQAYADSLEPIFVDFLNRDSAVQPPEMAALKKRIIRSMIEETRLLKGLAEQSGDAALGSVLDELETVLVSLSNLKPGDLASADLLDRTIRDRRMRFKLRELSGVKTTL